MYEENRSQGFDVNGNPDEHKKEEFGTEVVVEKSETSKEELWKEEEEKEGGKEMISDDTKSQEESSDLEAVQNGQKTDNQEQMENQQPHETGSEPLWNQQNDQENSGAKSQRNDQETGNVVASENHQETGGSEAFQNCQASNAPASFQNYQRSGGSAPFQGYQTRGQVPFQGYQAGGPVPPQTHQETGGPVPFCPQAGNGYPFQSQTGGSQPHQGGFYQNQQPYTNYGEQSQPYGSMGNHQGVRGNQFSQTSQSGSATRPEPLENTGKEKKKKGNMASKVAGITAAALLFGVISGGTMVGVNMVADSVKAETYPQVSQSATIEAVPPVSSEIPASGTKTNSVYAMDVSAIVENAMPSIVAVNNTTLYRSNSWFGQSQTYEVPSSGSGIIVGQNEEELLIVTNNHVVEDSTHTSVVFIDQTSVDAAIKGTDADLDLAVIAVPLKDIPADTLSQVSVATLGNSDELKMGQGVIAIGNALGHGQSITVGFISALDREVTTDGMTTRNLLQTDAAINPGNSGGALLNMKGEVIGINAAKYSSTDVEGVGYAIPISKVEDIISSLMTKRTRNHAVEEGKEGYLGIQGLTVDDSMARQLGMPSGVFVSGIIEGGAASKTELREKDIITKFDDQTVRTMASLQELLKYYKEGETVNMTVQSLQNGEYVERIIEITLGGKSTLGENTPAQSNNP